MNEEVFTMFTAQLETLKPKLLINEKHTINMLTTVANDCIGFSDQIIKSIYSQWNNEICYLYLIDSIIKNIGKDYFRAFENIDIQLKNRFQSMTEDVQDKTIRLLGTWGQIPLKNPYASLYLLTLKELTFNDLHTIRKLTRFAEYLLPYAADIVSLIYDRMETADQLSHLYLIDSIIKNVGKQYVVEFGHKIDLLVIQLLKNSALRPNIEKVVGTWQGIFSDKTLQNITAKINEYKLSQDKVLKNLLVLIAQKEKVQRSAQIIQELIVLRQLQQVLTTSKLDYPTLVQIQKKVQELEMVVLPVAPMLPPQNLNPTQLDPRAGKLMPHTRPKVTLDQKSIDGVKNLYKYLPDEPQCKQCALRFTQSSDLQAHMDWHFRQNKRSSLLSRDWYLSKNDWFEEAPGEKDAVVPVFGEKEQEEIVEKKFRKEGDGRCAICHEEFECEYDDDDEDWMVLHATKVNGKLYHSSCFGKPEILGKRKADEMEGKIKRE